MALKITATLVIRKGDLGKLLISQDPSQAAHEIEGWLRDNLPTDLPRDGITVTAEDVKRDGTTKTDSRPFTTAGYLGGF